MISREKLRLAHRRRHGSPCPNSVGTPGVEHSGDFLGQFLNFIGFAHHAAEAVLLVVGHFRTMRIAAGNDGADIGIQLTQALNGLLAPMPPGMVRSMIRTE